MSRHAPDSSSLASNRDRILSIDLTLELERQLENDSVAQEQPEHQPSPEANRSQSLDPQVLASLILQLRNSLSEVSRERDELQRRLSHAQSLEKDLKATVQHLVAECARTQDDLEVARRKIADDERGIAMLRAKVEESRRGVMRLQMENRRISQASLDVSHAGHPNKRASFTPLTGSGVTVPMGHRRMSSFSEYGVGLNQAVKDNSNASTSQDLQHPNQTPHWQSGLFRRTPTPDLVSTELEELRVELKSVQKELEETKRELCDVQEAKEASNTCIQALREFIQENNVGSPRDPDPARPLLSKTRENVESKKVGSGWTFKLWKPEPPVNDVSSPTRNPTSPIHPPMIPVAAPLSRKLGEFFGSRASMPSNTSVVSASSVTSGQDMMYPWSDGSSVDDSVPEPISPGGEGAATVGFIVRKDDLGSPELCGGTGPDKHDPPIVEIDL